MEYLTSEDCRLCMDKNTWEQFVETVEEMIFLAKGREPDMACIDFENHPAFKAFERYDYEYRRDLIVYLRKHGHKLVMKNPGRDGVIKAFVVDFT